MSNIYGDQQDEISVFLQQILLRSSSAPSDHHLVTQNHEPVNVPGPNRISGLQNPSAGGTGTTSLDNNYDPADDYDYESEEAGEGLIGDAAAKPTPPRGSSKRSRAAEVHNLSEKRRRCRINEKMKALQLLIPNSNKTDKASMLDEAIEYLKQLQLQVQMLTMRNGLSIHPICLPGMVHPNQVSPMRMNVPERFNKSVNTSIPIAIPIDHRNINTDAGFRNENYAKQAAVADFSTLVGSKASFQMEPSVQDQVGSFQFSGLQKGVCGEKVLLGEPRNEDFRQASTSGKGYRPGPESSSSVPLETQPSDMKKLCSAGGDHVLQTFVNDRNFSSHLDM